MLRQDARTKMILCCFAANVLAAKLLYLCLCNSSPRDQELAPCPWWCLVELGSLAGQMGRYLGRCSLDPEWET
jgi:hypothetical protein